MLKKLCLVFTLTVIGAGIISAGNAAETGLAPQSSNAGGIKVTVVPQNLTMKVQIWDFEVTLETHTQPLNDDLSGVSTLVADGKQYASLGWKGAPPGGHHRKGSLRFGAISPQPSSVELQIRLAGDSAPRSFNWILKGAKNDQ